MPTIILFKNGEPFKVTYVKKENSRAVFMLPKFDDTDEICYMDKEFKLKPIKEFKIAEVKID